MFEDGGVAEGVVVGSMWPGNEKPANLVQTLPRRPLGFSANQTELTGIHENFGFARNKKYKTRTCQ